MPDLYRALIVVVASWALPYALRKYTPSWWIQLEAWGPKGSKLSRVFLSLPSVLFGALVSALLEQSDPWQAVRLALWSVAAPFLHHAAKASPLPYRGAVKTTAALLFLLAVGCAPAREACYAKAEANAESAARVACFDLGKKWDDCEAKPLIMSRLREDQEACP